MTALLYLVNLIACGTIWAAAMYFYLRHNRPQAVRHHYNQVALLLVAVGAFAAVMSSLRGSVPVWWVIALRVGVAMLAGRELLAAHRDRRREARA